MTNFLAEADTNGTVRVSIGYLQAAVDPNVIQMTGQAYSAMRAADSALVNSAIAQVGQVAGSVTGAAAK
jgi:metal-dependent amidase/aminoacylase/carboxypeptidase family protein